MKPQRRLAEEVTGFVHSEEDLKEAQKITQHYSLEVLRAKCGRNHARIR